MNPQLQSIFQQVIQAFRDGSFDRADLILKGVLQNDISRADTIFNLGIAYAKANRFSEALAIFCCLQLYKNDDVRIPYNLGLIHSLRGEHQLAFEAYDLALKIEPNDAEVLINKGSTCNDMKSYALALKVLEKAIQLKPHIPEAWSNKGVALNNLHLHQDSVNAYDEAIQLNPNYYEAWANKSVPLAKLQRFSEAIEACDKALSLNPEYAKGWSNKGNILHELKRYEEAITHFDKALRLNPDDAEAWSSKADALNELKSYEEAIKHYDKALGFKPDYVEAWSNKGVAFNGLKRYEQAIECLDKALSLRPDYAEGWLNKGYVLFNIAEMFDAKICFEKVLEQKSECYGARWAKLFTLIPPVISRKEDLQGLREAFSCELEQLDKWLQKENSNEAHEVVGSAQPFYLAYQELNNKEILKKYGQLCVRLMSNWQQFYKLQNDIKQASGKIKLGIVSEQIRNHSVWNAITKGLVFNLDTTKFEVHIFHLGGKIDGETHSAQVKGTSFTENQSSLFSWAKAIIEKNIDVILYPEIGMDSITTKLACLRLAPIQIAAWGHPETTGLPTIDYYLSAELFEGKSSQDAYTETLVTLPNLGCHYSRLPITPTEFDLESLGICSNEQILICPGVPFKYVPQHDWILIEIAKRLGKCKLIFFKDEGNRSSEILRVRLEREFNAANLVLSDYVVFIPWLKLEEFYGLMKRADVLLDTIGFSGFNTALQSVECALPIVTREGKFMRGRLACGILKRIGMLELIADSDDSYIELVIRLAQDKIYRNQIKEKMIASRNILYDDFEPIHAFEQFLINRINHINKL
jgi:predicted O-linked N-acetylglucosamine transferase (SPINDLY family)